MLRHLKYSLILVLLAGWVRPSLGQTAKPETDDRGKQTDDRAKQLFQEMEARLDKARTLECDFDIDNDIAAPGDPATKLLLKGSLFLAGKNQAREEIHERTDGLPVFHMLVSDGVHWWWHDKGSPPHLVNKRPGANLNAEFLTALARSGLSLPNFPLPPVEAPDSKERFPVSGFRLGAKEKIGQREAQRLDYELFIKGQNGPKGEPAPFSVTIWLDPETRLPMKRVILQKVLGIKITENYEKLSLDGKVDARKFDLPKVTKETIVEP